MNDIASTPPHRTSMHMSRIPTRPDRPKRVRKTPQKTENSKTNLTASHIIECIKTMDKLPEAEVLLLNDDFMREDHKDAPESFKKHQINKSALDEDGEKYLYTKAKECLIHFVTDYTDNKNNDIQIIVNALSNKESLETLFKNYKTSPQIEETKTAEHYATCAKSYSLRFQDSQEETKTDINPQNNEAEAPITEPEETFVRRLERQDTLAYLDVTKTTKTLGNGRDGVVKKAEGKGEAKLALKKQSSKKLAMKEFIFPKLFEAAQKEGLIPDALRFVPTLKQTQSKKKFRSWKDIITRKKSYVTTMPLMGQSLSGLKKTGAQDAEKKEILKMIDTLEKIGFHMGDIADRNILLPQKDDPDQRLAIADHALNSIYPGSIAEQFLNKFMKEHPEYKDYYSDDLKLKEWDFSAVDEVVYNLRKSDAQATFQELQKGGYEGALGQEWYSKNREALEERKGTDPLRDKDFRL